MGTRHTTEQIAQAVDFLRDDRRKLPCFRAGRLQGQQLSSAADTAEGILDFVRQSAHDLRGHLETGQHVRILGKLLYFFSVNHFNNQVNPFISQTGRYGQIHEQVALPVRQVYLYFTQHDLLPLLAGQPALLDQMSIRPENLMCAFAQQSHLAFQQQGLAGLVRIQAGSIGPKNHHRGRERV